MTDREHEQFEHVSTPAWFRRLPRIPIPRTSEAPRPEWKSPEEKTAERLADAHLEILSLPWVRFMPRKAWVGQNKTGAACPVCGGPIASPRLHARLTPHCAWLIAARACGIAD
jgi:hypothetical protein